MLPSHFAKPSSDNSRETSCKYCGTTVGAASRHTVQLCLATIYCQRGLHLDRQDDGSTGIGHLRSLHALGAARSSDERPAVNPAGSQNGAAAETAEARTDHSVSREAPSLWPGIRASAELSPGTAANGPHLASDQQAPSQARGHLVRPTAEQEFCSLLQARRMQLAAKPHASLQGVARKEGRGRHVADLASEDSAHGMSTERAACQAPESSLHRAGKGVASEGSVDRGNRLLELLKVVPQGATSDSRRGSGTHDTHTEATRTLSTLHDQMSKNQYPALLIKLSEQGHQQATFQLEIALRGTTAEETWTLFRALCGRST